MTSFNIKIFVAVFLGALAAATMHAAERPRLDICPYNDNTDRREYCKLLSDHYVLSGLPGQKIADEEILVSRQNDQVTGFVHYNLKTHTIGPLAVKDHDTRHADALLLSAFNKFKGLPKDQSVTLACASSNTRFKDFMIRMQEVYSSQGLKVDLRHDKALCKGFQNLEFFNFNLEVPTLPSPTPLKLCLNSPAQRSAENQKPAQLSSWQRFMRYAPPIGAATLILGTSLYVAHKTAPQYTSSIFEKIGGWFSGLFRTRTH